MCRLQRVSPGRCSHTPEQTKGLVLGRDARLHMPLAVMVASGPSLSAWRARSVKGEERRRGVCAVFFLPELVKLL